MIYHTRDESGFPPCGLPCRIIDANGAEPQYVVEWDTETGRVVRLKRGADGWELNADRTAVLLVTEFYAPPLQTVPMPVPPSPAM